MAVPEMGRYLRQTVDNSLEEGQFESAIAMLDQLRSPDHRPSLIHILHLIFIALHPAHDCQLNDDEPYDPATLLLQSPRKIIKQTKASLILSAAAVLAAQRLLLSFISTNSPQAIGAALPFYPETKNEPLIDLEFSESPIFNQSAAIKTSAKSVWEILKSGYTTRATQHFGLGTPKGKGRQSTRVRFAAEPSYSNVVENIRVVGDDSWFVLEWLVMLFERDAEAMEKEGQPRYSPLLFKQLPPPPMGSTTRWDASEPLKVIFYAFQQSDVRRQRTGLRLLTLLIDLTQSSHLNLASLASTVLAQLTASTSTGSSSSSSSSSPPPHTPSFSSSFNTLFTLLPTTPAALSFKLALCKKILEDALSSSDQDADVNANASGPCTPAAGSSAMKRPRAQPRALARQRTLTESTVDGTADGNASSASVVPLSPSTLRNGTATAASAPSPTYVARLPPYADIVRLAQIDASPSAVQAQAQAQPRINKRGNTPQHQRSYKPWAAPALLARVKFELLLAYVLVQVLRVEAQEALEHEGVGTEVRASSSSSASNPYLNGASQNGIPPTPAPAPAPAPAPLDPPDAAFMRSFADGSFAALIREVFAPLGGNEDEERVGYVDVLRAVSGLPLSEEEG